MIFKCFCYFMLINCILYLIKYYSLYCKLAFSFANHMQIRLYIKLCIWHSFIIYLLNIFSDNYFWKYLLILNNFSCSLNFDEQIQLVYNANDSVWLCISWVTDRKNRERLRTYQQRGFLLMFSIKFCILCCCMQKMSTSIKVIKDIWKIIKIFHQFIKWY